LHEQNPLVDTLRRASLDNSPLKNVPQVAKMTLNTSFFIRPLPLAHIFSAFSTGRERAVNPHWYIHFLASKCSADIACCGIFSGFDWVQ
jgi:hypothetical protein